jgi:hypothetical protein
LLAGGLSGTWKERATANVTGSHGEATRTEQRASRRRRTGSTKYDRLEKLANAATQAAQARQWQARKNGMANAGEPAEVRSLNDDADARAQAEAAMQQMLAKAGGKPRSR